MATPLAPATDVICPGLLVSGWLGFDTSGAAYETMPSAALPWRTLVEQPVPSESAWIDPGCAFPFVDTEPYTWTYAEAPPPADPTCSTGQPVRLSSSIAGAFPPGAERTRATLRIVLTRFPGWTTAPSPGLRFWVTIPASGPQPPAPSRLSAWRAGRFSSCQAAMPVSSR